MRWLWPILFFLSACTSKPGANLASKACMVHKGFSTKAEVQKYLGPPQRMERLPDGREVWIYYEVKKDALASIPGLGERLGKEKIEVLRVTFYGDRVVGCLYYVTKPQK